MHHFANLGFSIYICKERKILGTEFSAFDEIVETAPCRVVSTLIYSIIKAEKCANMCEGDKNCFKTYEFGIFEVGARKYMRQENAIFYHQHYFQ